MGNAIKLVGSKSKSKGVSIAILTIPTLPVLVTLPVAHSQKKKKKYRLPIKSLILITALAAILVLLTVNTASATVNAPWTRVAVDTTSTTDIQCAKVGDADNDGDNEIISGNTSYIRMHEWSGTAWTLTIIGNVGTETVYDLAIADVNNTGGNKIAAALSNNTILMYNWTGTTWECSVVSTAVDDDEGAGAANEVWDLHVGNADNLVGNKIVACTESGEAVAFNWTAGSWSRTEICDLSPKSVNNVDVADCDNDGSIEVTTISDNKDVDTYHYNGGWALESNVDTLTTAELNLYVGDANNTGCNQIAVCTGSNDIYTYNWTVSWIQSTVTSGVGPSIYDIKIGDVYNDGTNRIVSGDSNEDVKIYTWTSSWGSFTVDDAAGGAVLEVTSGDADNDGLKEIVIGTGGTGDDIYMYESHWWKSYSDSGHTTECNDFASYETQHTVYMNGSGLTPSTAYRIIFWDGNGDKRKTDDKSSDANGNLDSSHTFVAGTDQAGTWYATVYDSQSYSPGSHDPADSHLVIDDTFEVQQSAIPEFPGVVTAIAVCMLCAVAYMVMRRKVGKR
jgi:hypothetical protein